MNASPMTDSRLSELRLELARQGLDGFIVPRADEHLGEYVPEGAERLAWLTGFTGSAGLAVVLANRAAVFSDGRYTLQLATQTDVAQWERLHIIETPPPAWLAQHGAGGAQPGRRDLDRPAGRTAGCRGAARAGAGGAQFGAEAR